MISLSEYDVDPNDTPFQIEITPDIFIFTTDDWGDPQTVTVKAVDDADVLEAEIGDLSFIQWITFDIETNDPIYAELGRYLDVTVFDNDCGAWGYSPADFDTDCDVDILDFAAFAGDWMKCTDPKVQGCEKF